MATATRTKGRSKTKRRTAKKRTAGRARKLSRQQKPDDMSLEAWQVELRRQFGERQEFRIENLGEPPIFSEFAVTNPESRNTYRVAIRGEELGANFCTCPDFVTNTLGTCKHIEFTLARLRRKRGGRRALADGFRPEYSEVYLRYGAEHRVRFVPGTDCPATLARLASDYFDDEGYLRDDAYERFEAFLSNASRIDHPLECREDVLGLIAQHRDAESRRRKLAQVFKRGPRSAAAGKLVKVPLYEYQREGALFAARAGRSLIGDEMGLGKTVQAIAAAEIMAEQFGVERVLVVCPTSLKHQWEREIARFADRTVIVIGGSKPQRAEQFSTDSFYKLTNYDTVYRDLEAINGWSPDLVILDEAQRIKNWNTRTARAVKKIKSPYAIVLTGTPLENRLEELVSIVQFVDQLRLGPTFRFLDQHQIREDGNGRVVGYKDLDRVAKTLAPILLRRRKADVLEQLPERIDKNFFVPMTPQQIDLHEENRELVARIVAKWRRYKFLSEADQRRLMIALQNMRMSCNSTYLIDHETDHGVKADELATLLDEVFEDPESKVVIFSQWTRTHELLLRRFADRTWDHVFFHGGVDSRKRKGLVDRFREDPKCRAFLATDAGGVGLNLQHASVVVNMDLPWNPAVLEQRIGRVHRMGQTRPVQVYNFVAQGTIEEGMLSILSFKKSMFAGVLDGGQKDVFLGGSRLKRFMESVEQATDGIERPASVEQSSPDEEARDADSPLADTAAASLRSTDAGDVSPAETDPWRGLLEAGLRLATQFVQAGDAQAAGSGRPEESPVRIERDEQTGQASVRFPLPEPEVIERALDGLKALLEGMRRRST